MKVITRILEPFREDIIARLWDKEYYLWRKNHGHNLEAYKNKHVDQDCFIIGNGPSLNGINMEHLNDYYTFASNKIYLLFDKYNWRPDFYVSVDREVINQSIDFMNKTTIPSFISNEPANKYLSKNTNRVNLFTSGGFEFMPFNYFPIFGEGNTVTYVMLQLAFFMGFKNVYLVGVDHNYVTIGAPNSNILLETEDQSHFHPDYFKGQIFPQPNIEASEMAYKIADYMYSKSKKKITDLSIGGKCFIFDKADFSQTLKSIRKK
ncbi:MAG: DUF115 domain-containing protein [Bacteroidetes bacterium]|nr:DUF115 domain-containing protein [Bacteroidota bacterium]